MPTRGTFFVAPRAPHCHLSLSCWMRWKRKEEGEEKERREGEGTACSVGDGTHLLGQVQLPAAVSLGPPKCVHCHLLSMRLTACQNKKPDRKSRKEYLEGRALLKSLEPSTDCSQLWTRQTITIWQSTHYNLWHWLKWRKITSSFFLKTIQKNNMNYTISKAVSSFLPLFTSLPTVPLIGRMLHGKSYSVASSVES